VRTRTLICQGSRDPFGTAEEVATYSLSPAIEIAWIEDGDHNLRPRKSVTGQTAAEARTALAARVAAWTRTL
jgi:predicted alpha/beta-hydrolase family hydrolase